MNVFLRVAAVVLLVAVGFLAGRFTPSPKRALDAFFTHTQKRALDALAAVRDAPQSLVSAELPPDAGSENFAAQVDRMPVGGIDPSSVAPSSVTLAPPAPTLPPPELSRFVSAAALYRKGDRVGADALAAQISDPFQRAALDWVALRSWPDRDRLTAFEAAHKDWPAADWLRDMQEGWLYSERSPAATIEALFAHDPPRTAAGVLAAVRAELDGGRKDKAASLVRGLWRDLDLDYGTEGKVLREFGVLLTRADHKYRADRLLYAEKIAPALRAAGLAGADEVALANARIEAMRGPLSPHSIASVPASLQSDPGLIFARVQDARRGNRTAEASAWLALAPHDPAALIDPDKWWTERRMVAREWLDRGAFKQAYDLCAAGYPIAYYGQLAARKLGRDADIAPREPHLVATGEARAEATRIIELYYDAGLDDFAASLAFSAARNWSDESQIAALGQLLARRGDARTNVTFGKLATERGFAVDETAFPTFGLPSFSPLPHSADIASVMAVARQESEFSWRAASGAGAKGLMQILPATAEMTARRAGVPFDFGRLIADPAFNLQLGAAYLGQLIDDEGGSLEMALAAYNAGAGRVAQWIAAYGDPRSGAVDPVDWVERIPYDETRDYVERVSENLGIYRARLGAAEAGQPGRVARE